MLTTTTEIRWFWSADQGAEPLAWFEARADQAVFEQRIDRYLLLPHCRTAGIKLRENCFEVKLLLDEMESLELTDSFRGRIQSWLKWTVANPEMNEGMAKKDRWISLEKQRYQEYFLGHGGEVRQLSADDRERANCRVETAHISVRQNNSRWLSLCIEADGDQESAAQTLRAVLLDYSRRTGALPDLPTPAASFSYPEWLAELQQGLIG